MALSKLELALKEHRVDLESLDFVNKINSFQNYYTTSSCAGRFVVLSKGAFRGKYTAEFVYKTHSPPINFEEVHEAISHSFDNYLYINVEPPTFHIACRTLKDAINLHQMAIDYNIGYSMFKTIKKAIVVEIRGTGMLQIPIGFQNKLFLTDEYLKYIISLSNEIILDEQGRLKKFEQALPLLVNEE